MRNMKNLWVLMLVMLPGLLFAQKLDKKAHDFGSVEYWDNPLATFTVTNNTKADMLFLPTFPAKDVLVQLPSGAMKPGESTTITVQYFTEKKGTFNRTVSLYTSNTGTPLDLVLKGDIRSFASGALTTCPTVGPKDVQDKMYSQEFQVIDSLTRQPIVDASIKLSAPDISTINGRTGKDGVAVTKVFVGFYEVEVTARDYAPYQVRGNLAPHQGRVVFELVRVAPEEPVVATIDEPWIDEPVEEPDPAPTVKPVPAIVPDEITADGTLSTSLFKPNNIVFVLDVSSSMRTPDKLPKLKESMKELVAVLRDIDYVTIVTFNKTAQVHIPTTKANNKQYLYDMIDSLVAASFTNGTKGVSMGYELALQNFLPKGNNQVIISTDGDFNNSTDEQSNMLSDIRGHTRQGIILSVVGFGEDPAGKRLMRRMANNGSGNYIHFNEGDTRRALLDEIRTQSLVME